LTAGAETIYDEGGSNEASNLTDYGRLYNWYAVNTGKLCPTGWHVPTEDEWTTLENELGGAAVAGDEMKSSPSDTPAWDGTNSSGFSALPGGRRRGDTPGDFLNEGSAGYWWTSTVDALDNTKSVGLLLSSSSVQIVSGAGYKPAGYSVRCMRDW